MRHEQKCVAELAKKKKLYFGSNLCMVYKDFPSAMYSYIYKEVKIPNKVYSKRFLFITSEIIIKLAS